MGIWAFDDFWRINKMSTSYDGRLYDNFKLYFPSIEEQVYNVKQTGPFDLTIKLQDDTSVLYCDVNHTIRRLPLSSTNMTEAECRREFGFRLSKILMLKGVTQKELARMTDISQVSLSNYMTGKQSPTFYTVDKIAKALGCSMEDFRYE